MTLPIEQTAWFTPQWVVDKIHTSLKGSRSLVILDPCAGQGALIDSEYLQKEHSVIAYEINKERVRFLRKKFPQTIVHCRDFLQMPPPVSGCFDLIIMNPPYEGGRDTLFIEHAMKFSKRIIVVLRTAALHGRKRHRKIWSKWHITDLYFCVSRPKFGGTGSPRHEFCVVDMQKHSRKQTSIHWW